METASHHHPQLHHANTYHERSHPFVFSSDEGQLNNQGNLFANSKDNVKVVIRVRPLNEREKNGGGNRKCVSVENEMSIAIETYKPFNFDYVADEDVQQNVIFKQIAQPIADCCLEGYNGTIFAYGQTGSGKTFTIQGPTQSINGEDTIFESRKRSAKQDENDRGIMQRSFEYIFDSLDDLKGKAESSADKYQFEYLIRCSYLEIYNEQILDLLEPTSVNLHIREDIKKGVYVEGLQEEVVSSAEDMISLIQQGAQNRHVGAHAMNKESSRSHSVLTTVIETKSMQEGGVWNIKTSRFHIIDLAGSERSKQTNSVGERLKEAGMINKSLSALGNVINSLVDISEGKSRHVHYRDSKLTFLLRDSLGGNSKTLIIANISPSIQCQGETLSTLKFAQRAKLIKNKAVINEDSSGTIQLLKAEISRLKKDLAESLKHGTSVSECQRCKAMLETIEDSMRNEEDEMLISFDGTDEAATQLSESQTIKKKLHTLQRNEISSLRSRVQHLENLLSANLETLSNQQKYYDQELSKGQSQTKRLQQTLETYEKQSVRDKMIIKFREERISKLEQGFTSKDPSEQQLIADLRKEVTLWKEAADHNTQAAKLFAEKSELQNRLDQLQEEVKQSPESMLSQIRSLTELNESLNLYLKSYCEESKNEVDRELAHVKIELAETIDNYTQKFQEIQRAEHSRKEYYENRETYYKQSIDQYKLDLQNLEGLFQKEKDEMSQSIHTLKVEFTQTKDDSQRDLQVLKLSIAEKETQIISLNETQKSLELKLQLSQRDFANLSEASHSQNSELTAQLSALQLQLSAAQTTLDTERASHLQVLAVVEQRWEQHVKDLEAQALTLKAELVDLTDQLDQAKEEEERLSGMLWESQAEVASKEREVIEVKETIRAMKKEDERRAAQDKDLYQQLLNQTAQNNNQEQYYTQKIEEITKCNQNLQSRVSGLESLIESQRSKADQDIKQLQQMNLHEINEIKSRQNKEIESLKTDFAHQLASLENSNVRALSDVKSQYESSLHSLQTQHSLSLQALQSQRDQLLTQQQREGEIMMDEYVAALNKQKQLVHSLQAERDRLHADLEEKNRAFEVITQKLRQVEDEAQTLRAKKLEESLQEHEEEVRKLRQEVESVKKVAEEMTDQYKVESDHLHQQVKEVQQQLQLKNGLIEQLIGDHESQIAELNSLIGGLQAQNGKLEAALCHEQQDKEVQLARASEEQQKAINLIERHIQKLQLEKLEEDQTNMEEEREEYRRQVESLSLNYESQIHEVKAQNQEILMLNTQQSEQLSAFSSQIIALTDQNSKLKSQCDHLQAQLQLKMVELSKLTQHLDKITASLSETQSKISQYHTKTIELNSQLEHQLKQNGSQLQDLESKNKEIKVLQAKAKELGEAKEAEAAKLTQQNKAIMEESMGFREKSVAQCLKLQEQITQLNNEVAKISQKHEEIARANTDLENEVAQLREQLASRPTTDIEVEYSTKLEQLTLQHSQTLFTFQQDLQQKELQISDLQTSYSKAKRRVSELEDLLKQTQAALSRMSAQESELKSELQQRFHEFQASQDKLRRQVSELKRESEGLKELVKLKDKQIEDMLRVEQKDRENLEKVSKDNKDVKNQLTKREVEMKEALRAVKFFSEQKTQIEAELQKLQLENQQLIGHKNPSQKIQHHLKIKEENNRLREENRKFQEELKRKVDIIGINHQEDGLMEKNVRILIDHLFSQPIIARAVGIPEDYADQVLNQHNITQKLKKAMEVITTLGEYIAQKDTRSREVENELKRLEAMFSISEKERLMVQQQHREIIQSPILNQALTYNTGSQIPLQPVNIANKQNHVQVSLQVKPKPLQQPQLTVEQQQQQQSSRMTFQHQQLMMMQTNQDQQLQKQQTTLVGSRGGSTKRLVSSAWAAFMSNK